MTVLNLALGRTIFTEGGHYSPVNNVLGGQYSLVNNVRGDIFRGDTVHYDNGNELKTKNGRLDFIPRFAINFCAEERTLMYPPLSAQIYQKIFFTRCCC